MRLRRYQERQPTGRIKTTVPFQSRRRTNSTDTAAAENQKLSWMFTNCFPNTLDTTVHFRKDKKDGKPDTFVYTGDIHAMWLRDSGAQVWSYVQLANEDKELKTMLAGVINRQFKLINVDPFANAFNDGPIPDGHWKTDLTDMNDEVHERKWEIDSLCYPLRLAYHYWKRPVIQASSMPSG